jgi:hypothetical protein
MAHPREDEDKYAGAEGLVAKLDPYLDLGPEAA